ncbi:unnamed protein product [Rotaria sp. Silwood2]|nr:unnamed protein product [Rotaria sp. Silwood2]CAF4458345.1 unnamed protein product [Rotaria sp. Silwood2]
MGAQNSTETIFKSTMNATASNAPLSTAILRREHMTESYLVIWADANIDPTNEESQHILAQLCSVVNQVNTCTTTEQCVQWLNKTNEETSFVISSGALGQQLVPNIHGLPKLDAIYIFCGNKQFHEGWAKNWTKIKGVYTSINPICDALKMAVKQYNQNTMSVSIIGANEGGSSENLNQLDPTFMYSQISKEILLDMEHDQKTIKDFVKFCQEEYLGNAQETKIIEEFERNYEPSKAIWWYTRQCFIYKMLNRALRTLDSNIMIRIGFFLCDIHRQVEQLHKKQVSQYHENILVYRGQGLLTADFEKLSKNKGGLLSFNSFLSTSKNREMSLDFADRSSGTTGMVGILFQMTIDPTVSSTPFASIQEENYFKDEEVFFSMHTVFRIDDIRKIDNNRQLYEVDLKITSNDDQQIRILTSRIREEIDASGWYRMGMLLVKIGQFDKAEELYIALLEQSFDDSEKGHIYFWLGWSKDQQGQHKEALSFYEKALEISRKILPDDHPTLAHIYSNIGIAYNNMGDYSKTFEFYDKARQIYEKSPPPNHLDLAICYAKIGSMYDYRGDYSKALEFYEKAHQIKEKVLSPYHSDLAISYSNVGQAYNNMGDYSKALEFYEKALKIEEKALCTNDPSLAASYNNIGQVYKNMGDYSKALEYYEKAHQIKEKALPSNHPDLALSYNNIGAVYKYTGDYSRGLEFYEKALNIGEKSLPVSHPDLAISYNNIGLVYKNMSNYSKALKFYEKALKIKEKALPSNHPSLAISYNNIGQVYNNMGDYSKAFELYDKAHKIREEILPPNHPDMAISKHDIGLVYENTKEYSKASQLYERAIEIAQLSLPMNHPHLQLYRQRLQDVKIKL